jgi:hypothetical protein
MILLVMINRVQLCILFRDHDRLSMNFIFDHDVLITGTS